MLARPATHAFAPHTKTARLHMPAHNFNDLSLAQPRLRLNRIKAGFVVPREGDNLGFCQRAAIDWTRGEGNKVIGKTAVGHISYTPETAAGWHFGFTVAISRRWWLKRRQQ